MMKKVLILMFILGLVSTANASMVTFKAGGSSGTVTVAAGDTVEITIVADTASSSGYLISTTETTTSAAGHTAAQAAGRTLNTGFTLTKALGNVRNAMTTHTSQTNRYILTDRTSGTVNVPNGDPGPAAGQILFLFDVVVPTAGANGDTWTITAVTGLPVFTPPTTQYLHQIDGANVGTTNAITLYIPEPMTIALLGLGGLFLRRRR